MAGKTKRSKRTPAVPARATEPTPPTADEPGAKPELSEELKPLLEETNRRFGAMMKRLAE